MIELTLIVSVTLSLAVLGYMVVTFTKTTMKINDSNRVREYGKLYRVYSAGGDLMFYGDETMARGIQVNHTGSVLKGSP